MQSLSVSNLDGQRSRREEHALQVDVLIHYQRHIAGRVVGSREHIQWERMKAKPDPSTRKVAPNDHLARIHAPTKITLARYMEVSATVGRQNIVILGLGMDCFGVDIDEGTCIKGIRNAKV